MQRTFRSANRREFQDIVAAYPFTRDIVEVHLHHTWKPRQSDYRGLETIEEMWRHHTATNGWDDIGQHVTVAPDGAIWLCRNFNWSPASARGFNGNRKAGPFMIAMIGDFDIGRESATDAQVKATLTVIKSIQQRFALGAHALRFHDEMSDKSCPGSAVDKRAWIERVERHALGGDGGRGSRAPFPRGASRAWELMREMNPDAEQTSDMLEAEHGEEAAAAPRTAPVAARAASENMLEELTGHVINLERGRFSATNRIETTAADVDSLFEELLPREIAAAKDAGRPARILFHAHGGLVSEKNALQGALRHLRFWRANGVYPVFFVWETGLAETVRQLVEEAMDRTRGARGRGPLEWFGENVTDHLIEEVTRVAGGRILWSGMQSSAELASAADGGAARVAKKLRKLVRAHRDDVAVHTVGHSAGSIFHAHFMSELARRGVPVASAHYLAPAIRNDLFHRKVTPLLGDMIGSLTLYTMRRLHEKRDSVTPFYRKSLLYLVHEAFECQRRTPILGLEESLRDDRIARELFGLRGSASGVAEVVWSPSTERDSGSASESRTHAGFDEDAATMESVARRVLERRGGEPIEPFPAARATGDFWREQFEWPPGLEHFSPQAGGAGDDPDAESVSEVGGGEAASHQPNGQSTSASQADPSGGNAGDDPGDAEGHPGGRWSSARRKALCIGIDAYRRNPLAGCVADATLWQRTLESIGFETRLLTDAEASADAILAQVSALVGSGRAGDHLVLQFAGHGTQFTDEDGDESDGDSPAHDECLCAADCDFSANGLVIDDELRAIIDTLADGVSMTCFFDCCHSGSATRMALMLEADALVRSDVRARFLEPNETMRRAYRNRLSRLKARTARSAPAPQKDVLFSACRSTERAYESDGQGDFTRRAIEIINGIDGSLGNTEFLERVLAAFGSTPRQTPEIHCDFRARDASFLSLRSNEVGTSRPLDTSGTSRPASPA